MVPNSLKHIILVSFRMQKRKKKHILQTTKCINSNPCLIAHTYCDASWNTKNQEDMREVAEQSVQVGDKLCVVGKAEEARTSSPPATPHPTHI